jgi:ribosomal peptide maturation radical SAM protein 1
MSIGKVQMVCMPLQVTGLSPLSVPLLSTLLRQNGVRVDETYLHFDFAEAIGPQRYNQTVDGAAGARLGELLFAQEYHGTIEDDEVQRSWSELFGPPDERRRALDTFGGICMQKVAASGADLIGFSTSCNQLLPSLWLARSIKERWPGVRIVLGGSACAEPMGRRVFEAYPEVDYVVSGYGEEPLLDLALGRVTSPRALIVNEQSVRLDDLPIPDYGPFLEQARACSRGPADLMLAFETSRGCWWGQKSHCTFCGLNQAEIVYNAKSSRRAEAEIRSLWESYGAGLFATDTILSRTHVREVLPRLAAYDSKPSLFYEVKSNMRASEVRLLRQANVQWVQPGIESLSTPLLGHLRKGVTALQNLAFLKWAREEGVRVSWNLLCGIPGERLCDYEEQVQLMSRIPHLQPPHGVSPIRIDRFSPYFEAHQAFGWSQLRPNAFYHLLHPQLSEPELADIAYHFDPVGGSLHVQDYLATLQAAVSDWQRRHAAGDGLFWNEEHGLVRIAAGTGYVFERSPALETLLRASHGPVALATLLALPGVDEPFIRRLVEEGVLYREGSLLVNLAVTLSPAIGTSSLRPDPKECN